jgi:3-hydroxyisobutyrate dehydrogenase
LGNLGAPLARRILDAGYPLTIWARQPATLAPFSGTAAQVAASARELAAAADVIGLCVRGDADVCTVMEGDDGVLAGARPGTVVAIHSTVHPDLCRRLAEQAAARDIIVLDAPLSGGHPAAENGELLVMMGGDEAAAEQCRPLFESFASHVLYMGPIGTAQQAKIVNNALLTANIALARDAIALGPALDIDTDMLARALQYGTARSFALDVFVNAQAQGGMTRPGWGLLRKDIDLMIDTSRRAHADSRSIVEPADRFLEQTQPTKEPE